MQTLRIDVSGYLGNCVYINIMVEELFGGGVLILIVLLFLRYGGALCDYICRTIDPAPGIIEEYQP